MTNAPPRTSMSWVGGISGGPRITWENGRIAAEGRGPGRGVRDGRTGAGACRGVRYFTGRWYETR